MRAGPSCPPLPFFRALIGVLFLAALIVPGARQASAHRVHAGFIDQGTLTYATSGDIADLDPANNEFEYADTVERNIDDTLVLLAGTSLNSFEPDLATSWSSNKDKSVWTVHLRHGVKFHTGRCCMTADDVKYSYVRSVDAQLGGSYMLGRFFSNPDKQIKILDTYTVEFDLGHGQPFFLAAMAQNYNAFIFDAQAVRKHATSKDKYVHNWVSINDAGSGPYTIQSWQHGQQMVLARFSNYWRGWDGKHFSKVVISEVPAAPTRRDLMERGQADITIDLTPQDYNAIKSNPKIVVASPPATEILYAAMAEAGPLASPAARQAVSYAFNYDAMVNGVYKGYASRSNGVIPSAVFGYNPKGFSYQTDITRARTLARQSGLVGKTLTYSYDSGIPAEQLAGQILQAQLSQIGVTLKLQALSTNALTTLYYSNKPASQRPNLMAYSWWPDYNDPYDMADTLVDSAAAAPNGNNLGLYHNKQVDSILAKMKYAEGGTLINLAHQLQDLITRVDPACLWIMEPAQTTALASNLQGVIFNPVDLRTFDFYPMHRA